jgi:hypothetical protein
MFVALASAGTDPTPLTGATLAASLTDEIGAGGTGDDGECKKRGKRWRCNVADPGGSTFAVYDVSTTSPICWEARLRAFGERAPRRASGCVD